jgi:hypothetical protein
MSRAEFTVPVRATSSLNARLHWRARARLVKGERMAVALAVLASPSLRLWRLTPPLVVTLTRIGPRKLDSDNVQGALKAIRDEVAAQLGLDDGDERIEWRYGQERGPYAVRVTIQQAGEVAA